MLFLYVYWRNIIIFIFIFAILERFFNNELSHYIIYNKDISYHLIETIRKVRLFFEKYCYDNNIDENKVIVVIDKDMKMVDKRITGLIATNLVDIYKKPVVLLSYSSKQDKYTGSMRGYGTESFKKLLESTEIIKVIGHDNSAGVEVQKKDIPRLIKRINKVMEDVELKEPAIDIDTVLDLKEISFKQMNDVLDLSMLFNSFCPKPQFLIKDKEINLKDIRNP